MCGDVILKYSKCPFFSYFNLPHQLIHSMLASLIRLAHPTARAASRSFASFARPNSSGLRPVNLRKPPPKRIDENTPEANLDCPETSSQLDNSLLSPVYIPEDPNGVLKSSHPAARLLDNSGLVVQRQLELGNLLLYAVTGSPRTVLRLSCSD